MVQVYQPSTQMSSTKFCCINRFNDAKTIYNLPTPYIIYIDFPPLFPPVMAISARRRLTNKSWLLTEPHASHAMRATRRFPFAQAKNNKQVKLSITETDNNTHIKECCRIGLARDRMYRWRLIYSYRMYRVCTLSHPLN